MDFLGAMKTIEQFVYELMSWVLFYPLTMLRVLISPMQMTEYVLVESGKEEKDAFSTAMRPTLFLLLSLAIGAVLVPFTPHEVAMLSESRIGKAITESLVALVFFRMVAFTFFPIAGALIYDIFTPGEPSRDTLRLPFAQQCYILAPFALIVSPCLVLIGRGNQWASILLLTALAWLIAAEFVFFRRQAGFSRLGSLTAAVGVIMTGIMATIIGAVMVA